MVTQADLFEARDATLAKHASKHASLIAVASTIALRIAAERGTVSSPEVLAEMRESGFGQELDVANTRFMGSVLRQSRGWECVDAGGSHARWRRRNDPLPAHVRKRIRVNENTGCWEWTGRLEIDGYARLRFNTLKGPAHRIIYGLLASPVPRHLSMDHLCRVRHCVNPDHLEPVTAKENSVRSPFYPKNRTACPRGHVYDNENTRIYRERRHCRACDRIRHREEYWRAR